MIMRKLVGTRELKVLYCFLFSFTMIHAYEFFYQDTLYKDSLCNYTWNQDINDCPDVLECIYPGEWQDKIISVAKNVTRISKDGLKLCLIDAKLNAPADIIYIMDLSGSMVSTYPNSGDPFKKRDDALEAGFNYQVNNFSQSTAGYIGFGTNVVAGSLMQPVNVSTGQNLLNNKVAELRNFVNSNSSAGGTNYNDALQTAISWIQNPSICPNTDKSIIFISDGKPDPATNAPTPQQITALQSANVPVYGIFLGASMAGGEHLQNLSSSTGGTSTLVPPANTDTLETVVENIVKTLIKEYQPKSLRVTNSTTNVTAFALNYAKNSDTSWSVDLDRFIPVAEDVNEIHVVSAFGVQDGSIPDTTLAFRFFLDVDGPYTSECLACRYKTTIQVYHNNTPVDTLTWLNNEYTIKLTYYGTDTLREVDVVVKTQKGDYETIHIDNPTSNGEGYIFEKTVPFTVNNNQANTENGTTESNFEDMMTLAWKHPSDVRDTATDTVFVSAPPNKISIYDQPGDPSAMTPYKTSPNTDTITAGITAELYAKVFSDIKWLPIYENDPAFSKQITWLWVDAQTGSIDSSIGTMANDSGAHNSFMPIKAYRIIDVTASLDMGSGSGAIKEKIRLYIKPGPAKQLVIEATNDINQTPDLNNPVPWNPIIMPNSTDSLSAFAILRDSLGNWVGPATSETWGTFDPSVVSVSNATGAGEGAIKKGASPFGQTKIHAWQGSLKDTTTVITLQYDIIDLRIVRVHSGDTSNIDNLVMNTNQDTTLFVQGLRSDNSTWELIDAKWEINPLATEKNPPSAAKFWTFSPSKPDTGIIFAKFTGNSDTVTFIFTVGPPIKISFDIITPDSLLIAGETIKCVVSIFNEDGPIPGLWKYPAGPGMNGGTNKAQYWDILDTGEIDYIPSVKTLNGLLTEDSDNFSTNQNKGNVTQSFYNGIDTLDFTLYFAPYHEPLHQLSVSLDNLTASTDPFVLKPGPIHHIDLTPSDSIITFNVTDQPKIISAKGYDLFGNYLKFEPLVWSNDTSLFDFTINAQSPQVLIDPSIATKSQEGYVYCTSVNNPTVVNKFYLVIEGPKPTVLSAHTADENGNGLLDAIILKFNKAFSVPEGFNKNPANLRSIRIVKNSSSPSDTIAVDSFVVIPFSQNTKFKLYLNETRAKDVNVPQSAWTPLLTLNTINTMTALNMYQCIDGAPPVVWSVLKNVIDVSDRTKDEIIITLSENFYNYNGSSFLNAGPKPELVFYTWTVSAMGDTIRIDSIFAEIKGFTDQNKDVTKFIMTNGQDLNGNHFVNLVHTNDYIADKIGNTPIPENQKVRVRVKGKIGDINVGPVPINPTIKIYKKFNKIVDQLVDIPISQIFNIVKTEGGTTISIELIGNVQKCRIDLYVFDAIGNPVFYQYNADIIKYIKETDALKWKWEALKNGEKVQINLYWSGVNDNQMKTAPGIYKIILYRRLEILDPNNQIISDFKKYSKTVAVGRNVR